MSDSHPTAVGDRTASLAAALRAATADLHDRVERAMPFLDERLTLATGIGFALIIVGCLLATGRTRRPAVAGAAGRDVTCDELAQPVAEP